MNLDTLSFNGSCRPDLSLAITQVEETVAPLARANAQIRDSLELLERNLFQLRTLSGRTEEQDTES